MVYGFKESIENKKIDSKKWIPYNKTKPWVPENKQKYECTVVIPSLGCVDLLKVSLDLWKKQDIKCLIQIIDTGSTEEDRKEIEKLREPGVEVHFLSFEYMIHSSEAVSVAMDFAFQSCRTEYLINTHNDCFIKKQSTAKDLISLCSPHEPVVGFQISSRIYPGWDKLLGHTLCIYHMPTMLRIGALWNMRLYAQKIGIGENYKPNEYRSSLPDTENGISLFFRENGITPLFIGTEENRCINSNEWFDHIRSASSKEMLKIDFNEDQVIIIKNLIKEAEERSESW
jgi:hypothetical protein